MKNKYAKLDLGTVEAVGNMLGGMDGIAKLLRGDLTISTPSSTRRLKFRDTVVCPAIGEFKGADNFQIGTLNGVKIGYLSNNFKKMIAPKVETDIAEITLRSYELLTNSKDFGIIRELEDGKEVVSLAHFHHLHTLQGEGQKEGPLLVNSKANISYIVGDDGNIWAVPSYWDAYCDGWSFFACPVEDVYVWHAGSHVFAR